MFNLKLLNKKIFIAPMAGGISNPYLVSEACKSGATGFLAAGYKSLTELEDQINQTKKLTHKPFGVNIFVPDDEYKFNLKKWNDYRNLINNALNTLLDFNLSLDTIPKYSDDLFQEKIDLVINNPVDFISFTFGVPSCNIIKKLHSKNIFIINTITNENEAKIALNREVDSLCIQGKEAGGHRATFHVNDNTNNFGIEFLLSKIRKITKKPIIVAGGIYNKNQINALIKLGADAVQIGTLFITSKESGLSQNYKNAIFRNKNNETILTRAYTGREARAINNKFIENYSKYAPRLYPEIHYLTSKIRKEADKLNLIDLMNLWSGINVRFIQKNISVKNILDKL